MDDTQLESLSRDIDEKLFEWVNTYKTSPLNVCGVVLARLSWLSKISDSQEDFVKLLDAPKEAFVKELNKEEIRKIH